MIFNKLAPWRYVFILIIGIPLFHSCQDRTDFKFERGKKVIYQTEYRDSLDRLISSEIIEMIGTGEETHFSDKQEKIFYNFLFSIADSIKFVTNPRLYTNYNYSNLWQTTFSQGIIHDKSRLWMHPLRANQFFFTQDSPFPHLEFPLKEGKKWEGFARTGIDLETRIFSNYIVEKQSTYEGLVGEVSKCWYVSSSSECKGIKNKLNMVYHQNKGFILLEYILSNGDRVTIEYFKEAKVNEEDYFLFKKRDEDRNR